MKLNRLTNRYKYIHILTLIIRMFERDLNGLNHYSDKIEKIWFQRIFILAN